MKVEIVCSVCGATCTVRKDMNRFERRHPALCKDRREFAKQLAQGVRCVEDQNGVPVGELGPNWGWGDMEM